MNYEVDIAGYKKSLKLFKVSDDLQIAAFILYGDVAVTQHAAKELLARAPEFDIMLTSASKSIPLIYEMARQGCREYIVARKGVKVYMPDPISVHVNSITTLSQQTLYLGRDDADKMKGKRVLIADDVISTGESLKAIEELVNKAGGIIVGKVAVLAEGDAADRDDIIFLEKLPVFPK